MTVDEIQQAHDELGHQLGWRFLYSPKKVLSGAKVAFIGLNPGGSQYEPPSYSVETGSAYTDESWAGHPPGQNPLQKQVCALFSHLNAAPSDVLAGNLVPFRSPDWKSLKNSAASLDFGVKLWMQIFERYKPSMIVCMSEIVDRKLANIFDAGPAQLIPINWGNVSASKRIFDSGFPLVRLPHLSRYQIFGREKSREAIALLLRH